MVALVIRVRGRAGQRGAVKGHGIEESEGDAEADGGEGQRKC